MNADLFIYAHIDTGGGLPSIAAITRATGCCVTEAHQARQAARLELQAEAQVWEAAVRWLHELRQRQATGKRTDIAPRRIASTINTTPTVAAAAVRVIHKWEAVAEAVRGQWRAA